jgi:hypothetical protein
MSYIGQGLPADVFSGFTTDAFTGDGSATTFTLSKAPFSEDGLIVVINNVIQRPTTNFTVSGTTLTIVGTAVASGDVIYAIHTSGAVPSTLASKVDVNGLSDGIILDADADTTISADTDDQIDIKIGGADDFAFKANNFEVQSGSTIDMNGQELILDADGDTSITADTDDQIDFKAGGTDILSLTATTATFNDGVTITTADNTDQLTLISTDADSSVGPRLRLFRNSGSPSVSDLIGDIRFEGKDNGGNDVVYAQIGSDISDTTDGSEDANLFFTTMVNGTVTTSLQLFGTFMKMGSAGSAGAPTLQCGSDANGNGIFQAASNHISLAANDSERFRIDTSGNLTATDTSIGSLSDERVKTNISDYSFDINKFKEFKPRNFDWINSEHHDNRKNCVGFIAQEIKNVDETFTHETIITNEKDKPLVDKRVENEKDVYYGLAAKLGKNDAMYISVIQQLISRIEALEDA